MGDAILFTICTIVKSEGYAFPGRRVEGNSGKQRGKSDAGRAEREFPSSKLGKLKTRGLLNHQFNCLFIIHRLLHSLRIPFQLNQIKSTNCHLIILIFIRSVTLLLDQILLRILHQSPFSSSLVQQVPFPRASLVLVLFADGKVQSQPNNDTQEQDHEETDDQQWLLQHHDS